MRTTMRFFLAVLATVAVRDGVRADPTPLTAPPKADDKRAPVYLPGGVTGATGEVGYLTTPKGDGLAAVDLETGKVLWETKEANQALVVDGTRLVARTARENHLRVVVLDTSANGKRLLESEPLDLPAWAAVALPWTYQGQNRRFDIAGQMVGGNLELDWAASAGYWGGVRPSPEQEKEKTAEGRARVNLKTGKVEMLSAAKVEGPVGKERPAFPPDVSNARRTDEFKDFSAEVKAVAEKNGWTKGSLLGPRAYGARGANKNYVLQAVESKTGKVLWERPIREWVVEHQPR
jgi:hypothetical protein